MVTLEMNKHDLLRGIATKLLLSDVRGIAVLLLDLWIKDLASHDVDGFLAEEAERLRDSDRRNTVTRRISDVLHGVNVLWFFVGKVLTWVEEFPNSCGRLVGSEILCEGPFETLMGFL